MTTFTKIRFRPLKDGNESLYLDTIYNGNRSYTTLHLIVKKNPKSIIERIDRKNALGLARQIALKKDMGLILGENEIAEKYKENEDFFVFANQYINENRHLFDIKSYRAATKALQIFIGKNKILFKELTEKMLSDYYGFLRSRFKGATPYNYYKKLRRIVRTAVRDKYLRKDPTENIKLIKGRSKDKDVLTMKEIETLWKTPCSNNTVKYGFLFSCLTGLRFCDIILLKWTDVKEGKIDIIQKKTTKPLTIPLPIDALQLLSKMDHQTSTIFKLPSHTGCLKILRNWVKTSGIQKHITWHCARHSLGTNLIGKGVDFAVVSKILGHSGLEQTLKYTRPNEELKVKAMKNFKQLFI